MNIRKTGFLLGFLVVPASVYLVLVQPAFDRRNEAVNRQQNAGKVVEDRTQALTRPAAGLLEYDEGREPRPHDPVDHRRRRPDGSVERGPHCSPPRCQNTWGSDFSAERLRAPQKTDF